MASRVDTRSILLAIVALVTLGLPTAYYAFFADFGSLVQVLRNRAHDPRETSSQIFAAFAPTELSEAELEEVAQRMTDAELPRAPMHWLCMTIAGDPDALLDEAIQETESLNEELILRLGSWRKGSYAAELAEECTGMAGVAGRFMPEERALFADFGPKLVRASDAIDQRLTDLRCVPQHERMMAALVGGRSAQNAITYCGAQSCLFASDGTTLRVASVCSEHSAIIEYFREGSRIANDSPAVTAFLAADHHETLGGGATDFEATEACEAAARVATHQPVHCETVAPRRRDRNVGFLPSMQGAPPPLGDVCVGEQRVRTVSARYLENDVWHDVDQVDLSGDMLGHALFALEAETWTGHLEVAAFETLQLDGGELPVHTDFTFIESASSGGGFIRGAMQEAPRSVVLSHDPGGEASIERLHIFLDIIGPC